jgi:hypothetical protein
LFTPPSLKTPRLHLEPLRIEDADAIQAAFPQWEIVRFLSNTVPWPYPADGALRFIGDHALPAMKREEACTCQAVANEA